MNQNMDHVKALIVVTNHTQISNTSRTTGWEVSEFTDIYYALIDKGIEADIASPKGGLAFYDSDSLKLEKSSINRFTQDKDVQTLLKNTLPLNDVNPSKYELVHFVGGHGTMWDFPDSKSVQKVAATIHENGGIVSAVCHGVAALVNVKLTNGRYLVESKKINSFTNAEEEEIKLADVVPFLLETKLRERGAHFESNANWMSKVVEDSRIVTGQNPQSMVELTQTILKLLQEKNK